MLGWLILAVGLAAATTPRLLGPSGSAPTGESVPGTTFSPSPTGPYTHPMAMPLGHHREDSQLRPLARREKLLAGGVGGVLTIILVVVLVVSLTHKDRTSGHGCIAVSLAYLDGGAPRTTTAARRRGACAPRWVSRD